MLQHTKELGRQLQRCEQSKIVTTNVKGLTISDTKRRQQNHNNTERDQVNFRCNSSAVKKTDKFKDIFRTIRCWRQQFLPLYEYLQVI